MSKYRKFLFISAFLIIDCVLLGCFFLVRDVTLKNILESEVSALVELDFTTDRYNSKVKSSGNYGIVEEAIKKYLDDYAVEVQEVLSVVLDEELNEMFTSSNVYEERPDFNESLTYVRTLQDNFNYNMDLLIDKSTEDKINEYIYMYLDDEEYVSLYHNLLRENNFIKEINDTKLFLENKRLEINNYFDSIYRVLEFLRDNDSNYKIEDGKMVFNFLEVEIQYNELIEKTKRIYE